MIGIRCPQLACPAYARLLTNIYGLQYRALNAWEPLPQAFIAGTIAADSPVVPISAQLKYNIDAVCEYLVKKIPVPIRCATHLSIVALI